MLRRLKIISTQAQQHPLTTLSQKHDFAQNLLLPIDIIAKIHYITNTPTRGVWVTWCSFTIKVMMMVTETNRSAIDNMVVPQKLGDEESQAVLALEGMTCASCAMRIEKGLKKVQGVKDASVNLATEQATVTYNPGQTGLEQMVQKVETVGYKRSEERRVGKESK